VGLATTDDPAFIGVTMALTAIGFVTSFIARQQLLKISMIDVPGSILFAIIAAITLMNDSPSAIAPIDALDNRQKALSVLITWLVVLRSFTLVTDARVLFCCVPTIALIALVSTMTGEASLVTAFAVFLCSANFLIVHEAYLRFRTRSRVLRRDGMPAGLLGAQLQITAVCTIVTIGLAGIVAIPLRGIGANIMVPRVLASADRQRAAAVQSVTVQVTESNEIRVGSGPVTLGEQILMRVTSDHDAYWRGATFNHYTGHGWQNDLMLGTNLSGSSSGDSLSGVQQGSLYNFQLPEHDINRVSGTSHTLRQTFRLEGSGVFNDMYSASEPRTMRLPADRATVDETGSVRLQNPLQGATYQVESQVADWSPDELKKTDQDYPQRIKEHYMAWEADSMLPNASRIRDVIATVCKDKKTVFDKVTALEQWVGDQCKYNTDTPASPADQDVVAHFLFTAKQGYCDSFATSLAVLCRAAGIPARVASGFAPGERDTESQTFVVRERDKHQWTEVYFNGVGWIPFDATAFAEDVSPHKDPNAKGLWATIMQNLFKKGWLPPVLLTVFALMLLYVLKVEVLDRLLARRKPATDAVGSESARQIFRSYALVTQRLSKIGLGRPGSETPREYLNRVTESQAVNADGISALSELTALHERLRYGGFDVTTADGARAKFLVGAIAEALKNSPRAIPAPNASASSAG
jgi:hypothetical protein